MRGALYYTTTQGTPSTTQGKYASVHYLQSLPQPGHVPFLDHATLSTIHTRGHNIKFILPHCSKDVYNHSFLPVALRGWNSLPQSVVDSETLNLFKTVSQVLFTYITPSCFSLAPCGLNFFVSAHFPFILFSGHHVSITSIDGS